MLKGVALWKSDRRVPQCGGDKHKQSMFRPYQHAKPRHFVRSKHHPGIDSFGRFRSVERDAVVRQMRNQQLKSHLH